ncbi:THUMP domain RNA-binding protein [Geotalea daltonii FRC-32]|uniref:THUMP domain RNA-binding protein n=1 Tax=Geotalea daltonii (strain DSM 22248 / JCM 15807 / FRC-32) TaxID=316067 RepID=B9M9J1_GEODF|nr:hypothetical protein [Geotalea daltonii]ACM20563.1 THUMP domain RNA-binding protein [Geotalea daltonii FRC-32]
MREWNAVVTVHEGGFTEARRLLEQHGPVAKSDFFNILLMRATDPFQVLAALHGQFADNRAIATCISRFMPMERLFTFQSAAEFEQRCRHEVLSFIPRLVDSRFHVRMHRRGFKGKLSSMDEERFLDEFLLQQLAEAGTSGKITFDDPDAVIALETVGTQGGLSLFTKAQLAQFPLLHLD